MRDKFSNLLKDNRGTVLLMTMLILISMLTVVLGAANLVMSGIKMSGAQERSTMAYFAAEAGAERILWEVRQNGFDLMGCSINDYIDFSAAPTVCVDSSTCGISSNCEYSLSNNASYNVVYSSNSPVTFTSTGVFSGLRRSVDISY